MDTVTYNYDALNRVVGINVGGASRSIGHDAAGRTTSAVVFGVNPDTGDVIDPAGDFVDNLGNVDSE
jgi:hypothetical protein